MNKFVDRTKEQWGQPPASHYSLKVSGETMTGSISEIITSSSVFYRLDSSMFFRSNLTAPYFEFKEGDLNELELEIADWDSLSDEALVNFEDSLE